MNAKLFLRKKNENMSYTHNHFGCCYASVSRYKYIWLIWFDRNLMICCLLAGKHQKRLIEKLFKNYDPTERPVANDSENLLVLVGLSIQQIVDIVTINMIFWSLDSSWQFSNLGWKKTNNHIQWLAGYGKEF